MCKFITRNIGTSYTSGKQKVFVINEQIQFIYATKNNIKTSILTLL